MSVLLAHIGLLLGVQQGTWTSVLSVAQNSNSPDWSGYTLRQRIASSRMLPGTKLRLILNSAGFPLNLGSIYIGQEAVGGGFDFAATPTRLYFGGSGSISSSGGVFSSDEAPVVQDGTKNLIISMYFSGTTTVNRFIPSPISTEKHSFSLGDKAAVVDWSGSSESTSPNINVVSQIEVFN